MTRLRPLGSGAIAVSPVDIRESESIYARIGGPVAVRAVVENFYQRVLADPSLAPAFAGVDLKRLREHQGAFLGVALGGDKACYRGRSMKEAHAGLGITKEHFAGVTAHLHDALRGAVADDLIEAILATVAGLQADIVEG